MDPARAFTAYARNAPGVDFQTFGEGLRPEIRERLARAQAVLPFPIRVSSGARTNNPNSQHYGGNAVDISMRDLSDEQRLLLARAMIREAGFNRIGAYSGNTGLHVDMKDQRRPDGKPWAMFDKTAMKLDAAPEWFRTAVEATPGQAFAARAAGARAGRQARNGNEITVRPRSQAPEAPAPEISTFLGMPTEQAMGLGAGLLGTIVAAFGGFGNGDDGGAAQAKGLVQQPMARPEMPAVVPPEAFLGAPRQAAQVYDPAPALMPAAPEIIGNQRVRRG